MSRCRCYTLFNLMETDMKKATVNLTSLQNILWSSHCSTNQHCNLNPLMFNRKHTCKMVNCQNHFSRGYLWSQIGSLQIMLCFNCNWILFHQLRKINTTQIAKVALGIQEGNAKPGKFGKYVNPNRSKSIKDDVGFSTLNYRQDKGMHP